jgi:hypothetical protein
MAMMLLFSLIRMEELTGQSTRAGQVAEMQEGGRCTKHFVHYLRSLLKKVAHSWLMVKLKVGEYRMVVAAKLSLIILVETCD